MRDRELIERKTTIEIFLMKIKNANRVVKIYVLKKLKTNKIYIQMNAIKRETIEKKIMKNVMIKRYRIFFLMNFVTNIYHDHVLNSIS